MTGGVSVICGAMPTVARRPAQRLVLAYTIAPTSIGLVLVAASERGVCLIHLGKDPDSLLAVLRRRYPVADLRDDDPRLAGWAAKIVAAWESPAAACDVPVDVRGTAFQLAVWDALRAIPPGETVSYAEIARRIGRPKAVRAVGSACGRNPIAPLVPCHRVLASDGGLGGYGFGLETKRALLEKEKAAGKR